MRKSSCLLLIMLAFISLTISCSSNKKITYFRDVPDSLAGNRTVAIADFNDPKIQPNDILQISVQTLDPQASAMAGTSAVSSFNQGSSPLGNTSVPGFLVDKNGMIELPMVGKIDIGGKTTTEAKDLIRQKAAIYYKDPVVNVRFANFNVTVLGEVTRPAQYNIPNEKASVLDALGLAGDLTIYAKRENVLLIREENGQKKFIRFDLTSSEIFRNPYFYLKQGDVIYVEPGKSKLAASEAARSRTYTVLISAASLLVVILSRINF